MRRRGERKVGFYSISGYNPIYYESRYSGKSLARPHTFEFDGRISLLSRWLHGSYFFLGRRALRESYRNLRKFIEKNR